MTDENEKADVPADAQPTHEAAEALTALKQFANTHGNRIVMVVAVVLVVTLGIRFYRAHHQTTARQASAEFASAASVQDLEALVDRYGSAPSALLAKLRLAKSYFDIGNYDLALTTYEAIRTTHGDHPLAPAARLGIAHCQEAKGQPAEALVTFDGFLKEHAGHFLSTQALFGKARCLDRLSQTTEARTLIEDYIAANPDGRWLSQAEELLKTLGEHTLDSEALLGPMPPLDLPSVPVQVDAASATGTVTIEME